MKSGGEISNARGLLAEKIAGEITLSQKSRRHLAEVAAQLRHNPDRPLQSPGISPSVISDYESGRRKSPGIMIVEQDHRCAA